MKQKNILFVIAILVVLGLGLFIVFYPKEKSSVCCGFCSSEFKEALNKSDVSLCEFTKSTETTENPYYDNYCRESCIAAVAYKKDKKENAQLCELINSFKDIPHAEGWDDPRETGSVKDYCYIHLASKLDNVSLCNNVETDWASVNCPFLYETNRNRQ